MSTKDYNIIIIQQVMVNEVIYTRKAAIDQFIDGLCALSFFELLVTFPLAFEPLFLVYKASLAFYRYHQIVVLTGISPDCSSDRDQHTFSMLSDFVKSLDSEGQ